MRTGWDACVTNHVYDPGKAGFVTHPHMGLNVEWLQVKVSSTRQARTMAGPLCDSGALHNSPNVRKLKMGISKLFFRTAVFCKKESLGHCLVFQSGVHLVYVPS